MYAHTCTKSPAVGHTSAAKQKNHKTKQKNPRKKKNHIHRPVDSQTPARAAPAARVIVVPETATNSQKSAP